MADRASRQWLLGGTQRRNSAYGATCIQQNPARTGTVQSRNNEAIFWFVWMGIMLCYTTIAAIIGSVKWLLVSYIASDIFTVLNVVLWFITAVDLALNMHWMNGRPAETTKKLIKIWSRLIRIPLIWFFINLLLPLKAFDTLSSNQQLWNSRDNISVFLDTSLFYGSCIVYMAITVLLCILLGINIYKLLQECVSPGIWKTTAIVILIVLYCIMILIDNILRNVTMFNLLSLSSNSILPLIGSFIVGTSMMCFFLITVKGLQTNCKRLLIFLLVFSLILLVFSLNVVSVLLFYITVFVMDPDHVPWIKISFAISFVISFILITITTVTILIFAFRYIISLVVVPVHLIL